MVNFVNRLHLSSISILAFYCDHVSTNSRYVATVHLHKKICGLTVPSSQTQQENVMLQIFSGIFVLTNTENCLEQWSLAWQSSSLAVA